MNITIPDWHVKPWIRACTTTRLDGFSQQPFHGLNLAYHVGDCSDSVKKNREFVRSTLKLPSDPYWLEQIHSSNVVELVENSQNIPACDGLFTQLSNKVLAIMTADCMPILFVDANGQTIAAIHAGWRGTLNGIIEKTLMSAFKNHNTVSAWIGPSICQHHFEVGEDVYLPFQQTYSFADDCFMKHKQKWLFDITRLAKKILGSLNIKEIYVSGICTFCSSEYYSYRQEKRTGRVATLIWKNANEQPLLS